MRLGKKPNAEAERRDTPKAVGLDFYRSSVEAIPCLLKCEGARLRRFHRIHEMACGDGALVKPLRQAGFRVEASDIVARGCPASNIADYLKASPTYWRGVAGITNPPFNRAEEFILKACAEYDYVAMVLRLRYLGAKHLVRGGPTGSIEMPGKTPIWACTRIPFARVIIPDGRWSMMHRDGHEGSTTEDSMIDFGWFIWDAAHRGCPHIIMESQINAAGAAAKENHA